MPPDMLWKTASVVENISAQRILVIAPHPDDESVGCGGLIALLAHAGRAFHVVFVTDGGASHPDSRQWPPARLAAQREKEAEAALEHLGIGHHPRSFLRLPDSAFPALTEPDGQRALAALTRIIHAFQPDLALLPWRRDPHSDHRDAWTLARTALAQAGQTPATLEYAVWLEEFGEAADHPREDEAVREAFDVTEVLDAKRAAIMAHVSQTSAFIDDDPTAFCLTKERIGRLCRPTEIYWKSLL